MRPSIENITMRLLIILIIVALMSGCSKKDDGLFLPQDQIPAEDILSAIIDAPLDDDTIIYSGYSVAFECTVNAGYEPYTFSWDFDGDGKSDSDSEDPGEFIYQTAGYYKASLLITDSKGQEKVLYRYVQVLQDLFPTVSIDTPEGETTIHTGQSIVFSATVSGGNPSLTYNWDFGGGAYNVDVIDPGRTPFFTAGDYDVVFTATDVNGDIATDTVHVIVNEYIPVEDKRPVATIDIPVTQDNNVTINVGDSVEFQGSVISGNEPLRYLWTFEGGEPNTSSSLNPGIVVYNTADYYRATFRATDNDGDYSEVYIYINVLPDTQPEAIINSPETGTTIIAGQPFNFQGSVRNGNPAFSYNWDFGGGAENSTYQDPGNIIFNTQGTYTVTFTVTDIDGESDDTSIEVIVREDLLPTAVIDRPYENERTIVPGKFFNFQATATGGNDRLTYFWDFGDDDVNAEIPIAYRTREDPLNVVYYELGTYTVTFRVTDIDGDVVTDSIVVEVVEDLVPSATIESPEDDVTINNGESVYFRGTVADGNAPYHYSWNFNNSGEPSSSLAEPGEIRFYKPGTYTVNFKAYDSDGDFGEDTVVVTVNSVPITVPDVSGMNIYDARSAIEDAGFITGTVYCVHNDAVALMGIVSQTPAAGVSASAGSSVQVTVSLGEVDAGAYWSEKGSLINDGTNNSGIWFLEHDYPIEVGTLATGHTEQVLDEADPVYTTTWNGPFSVVPPIVLENADVLEEEYSVAVSASGAIDGEGTLTYTRLEIQSGTHAGSWIIAGTYELDGYTGAISGCGTNNTTSWSGVLEGDINGLYLHEGDQGEIDITSISGVQTSGSVTCLWDVPVNNYSRSYLDTEVLVQEGITWSGTMTGLFTGDFEHTGDNLYLPMYLAGQYIGMSEYDDQLEALVTMVQADELYAKIVSPFGDVTIDQGESLNFRSWVAGYNWPYTYEWDFNNDGIADSNQKNPGIISFDIAGTYPVEFKVIDSEGVEYIDIIDVTVTYVDTDPVAVIVNPSGDSSVLEGEEVTFEGMVTGGNAPFNYEWDFNGDGNIDSFELSPGAYAYNTSGTYPVSFNVIDNDGDLSSASITITVAAMQPVPDVAGMALSDAFAVIEAQGLISGQVYVVYSTGVFEGDVIRQDPAAGTMAAPGSSVNLTVSIGQADPNSVWTQRGLTRGLYPVSIFEAQHSDPFSVGWVCDITAEYLPSLVSGDNNAYWSGSFTAVPPTEMVFANVDVAQTIGYTGTASGETSVGAIAGDITSSRISYVVASGEYTGNQTSIITWQIGEYTGSIYAAGNSETGDFLGESSPGSFWGRVDGNISGIYRTTGYHHGEIYITSIEGVQASGTLGITWSGSSYNQNSYSYNDYQIYVQDGVSWSGQGSGCVTGQLEHTGTALYIPGFNVGQYSGFWFYYETDPNNYDQSGYILICLDRKAQSAAIVPFVEGLSQAGAEEIINSKGLVVGTVTTQSSGYPSGHVVSQSPSSGTTAVQGTSVNLIISQ